MSQPPSRPSSAARSSSARSAVGSTAPSSAARPSSARSAVGSTAPRPTGRPPLIRNRPLPARASTVALTSRFSSAYLFAAQSKLAKLKLERQEAPRAMAAKQRETLIFSPQGKLMTGAEVMSRFGANVPAWMEAPQRDPRPPAMGRSDDSKQPVNRGRHASVATSDGEHRKGPPRQSSVGGATDRHGAQATRDGDDEDGAATPQGTDHDEEAAAATRIQRLSRGRSARRRAGARRDEASRASRARSATAEDDEALDRLTLTAPPRAAEPSSKNQELHALATALCLPETVHEAATRFSVRHDGLADLAARRLTPRVMDLTGQRNFNRAIRDLTRHRLCVPNDAFSTAIQHDPASHAAQSHRRRHGPRRIGGRLLMDAVALP